MLRSTLVSILFYSQLPSLIAADPVPLHDTHGVLSGLRVASFNGSSQDSIQAVATDAVGNIYVAGTTYSPQFPTKNAVQSTFGDARVLRSTDLGVTWSSAGFPPTDVTVVVPDPTAAQVLFAIGATGIYKTVDAGHTWQVAYQFSRSIGVSTGATLAIDPGNHLRVIAGVPNIGILRSLDGGQAWSSGATPCPGLGCGGQLLADPAGSGMLVLNGGYASSDWGLTFKSFGPPAAGNPMSSAFDPSHPGWIYVGKGEGVMGQLYLSTDYGATWNPKASPPTVFSAIMSLAVDADQPNTLIAACADGLYKSTDGAASWTRQAGPSGPQPTPNFLPETGPGSTTFALVRHSCNNNGGVVAMGAANIGNFSVAFSADFGLTWTTPQLSYVSSVAAGPNCALYVTRMASTDAFVAKLSPDGSVQWATFLGGSDKDTPVGLTLDANGNAYVAGNTASPDFPTSVPHIGPAGENSVFVAKFSPDGAVMYSATVGGEISSTAVTLALDAGQNVYVAGQTDSYQFPVTPGAFATSLTLGSYTGFLFKLSSDATLAYATYLGPSYAFPSAILVDANDEPIVAGTAPNPIGTSGIVEFLVKFDRGASHTLSSTFLPASTQTITGMAFDPQNNLVVFGGTDSTFQATAGAFSSPQPATVCNLSFFALQDWSNAFVMKLSASNWTPIYGAFFQAPCGIHTGSIAIDSTGAVILALAGYGGLPLRSPLIAGPACSGNSTAIAKLSADGSTLQFATYFDSCGIPAIAVGPNGSIYAGVSPLQSGTATSVLRIPNPNPAAISIDAISNAFSADATAVTSGGLYAISTSGVPEPSVDLGLNPSADLPDQLGGVKVKFDGVPAAILTTSPGQIIVAAPANVANPVRGAIEKANPTAVPFTAVELLFNGVASNTVLMPVSKSLPGLLTLDYPSPVYHANYADANARNQDGTQNSATNPAPAGSTITLFLTGAGATSPEVAPGSIANSFSVTPVTPLYSTWQPEVPGPAPEPVFSLPGFVSAMLAIQLAVPNNPQIPPGTALPNGILRVPVGLLLQVLFSSANIPVSNTVSVYVKLFASQ